MNSVYIVIPAYNEEANIEDVILSWYPILNGKCEKSKIVVADSGSTDKTHVILQNLKRDYKQIEILENTRREHGPKLIALYQYAVDNGIDYVFQTDSDGQTLPCEFEGFWKDREKYDVILGNRIKREDGLVRILVEKVVCFMLWFVFHVKVPDANAPFRLMKSSVLKRYIYLFEPDYFLPNVVLTAFFCSNKETTAFKNISFVKRKKGKNSISIPKIVKIGMQSVGDFYFYKRKLYNQTIKSSDLSR